MICQHCLRDVTFFDDHTGRVEHPIICPFCHKDTSLPPDDDDFDIDEEVFRRTGCRDCE